MNDGIVASAFVGEDDNRGWVYYVAGQTYSEFGWSK
jgi:hypothetical protein